MTETFVVNNGRFRLENQELSWRYFDEMAKALAGDLICDPIREAREGI